MHQVTRVKELSYILPARTSLPKALMVRRLFKSLPSALKTPKAFTLLETYFHIPHPRVRRFVLALLARITDYTDTAYPSGELPEAEYLLTLYTQLPTTDMGNKVLALVRQVCTANRGNIGGSDEGY